jgi:hypothetical protein
VTGPRVIIPQEQIFGTSAGEGEIEFPYIVMNAAIGVKKNHIIRAVQLLSRALKEVKD